MGAFPKRSTQRRSFPQRFYSKMDNVGHGREVRNVALTSISCDYAQVELTFDRDPDDVYPSNSELPREIMIGDRKVILTSVKYICDFCKKECDTPTPLTNHRCERCGRNYDGCEACDKRQTGCPFCNNADVKI